MPRNIRNWWLALSVDGQKSKVATGPRSRSGGFKLRISMRSGGDIHDDDVVIEGTPIGGLLNLNIYADGKLIFQRVTKP